MKKTLFIVSTPIGNYEDITLRALNVLRKVDFIICEEFKEGRRLLSRYKIEKKLIELNEHNEEEASDEILQMMLDGKSAALISDCGTPLFSDPGHLLVDLAIQNKIDVIPVPVQVHCLQLWLEADWTLKNSITTAGFLLKKIFAENNYSI